MAKKITDAEYRTRFFDDLVIGERFESHWSSVDADDIVRFATEFDPQVQHVDEEAAAGSRFGGLIASGAHTFAVWARLNIEVNGDIAWIAGVGFEHFRLPNPLRAGVEFQARSELLAARVSGSDPTRGVTTHLHELWTRDEDCLFTAESIALVERRGR